MAFIYEFLDDALTVEFRVVAGSKRDAYWKAIDHMKLGSDVTFAQSRIKFRRVEHVSTTDDFDEKYPLARNHLDSHAAWDGQMFETYGNEEAFISRQQRNHVWSVLDIDDILWVIAGPQRVNRIGYLLSLNSWADANEGYVVA